MDEYECDCLMPKINKFLHTLVWQTYFQVVTFVFWIVNLFIPKVVVPCPFDSNVIKSATELRKLMKERKITCSEIIESYIKRIEEVNPYINAVVYKNYKDARQEAKEADNKINSLSDQELYQLYEDKPLFGLPFTVKDSMMVKGKPCTVGIVSRKLKQEPMPDDAVPVKRMKSAGAIHLAVTTVPETCLWIETNTVAYGKTRNPYDSRRIAGGSSGGEAALSTASASLMGIGSDMGGSIRIPCFHCGLFGFMPSPFKVDTAGHIPGVPPGTYKETMGRIGPITRFAEDLPLLVKILSDGSIDQKEKVPLKKIKIYYAEGMTHNTRSEPQSKETLNAMRKAVKHFEDKYEIIAQCVAMPETADNLEFFGVSISEEGEPNFSCLMRDITRPTEPVNCYWELLKSIFGQSEYTITVILWCISSWINIPQQKHKMYREKRDRFKKRIESLLGDDGVLFFPSFQTLPQYHWETVVKYTSYTITSMFNVLGVPVVQCPMGLSKDLPNGVAVVSNQGNDKLLLDIAQELSSTFGGWISPDVPMIPKKCCKSY